MQPSMVDYRRPLRRLLRRRWGRITEAEKQAGYRRGSLARIARGELAPGGERFAAALQLLGVDPEDFLRRAAARIDPEGFLEELPRPFPEPDSLAQLRRAAQRVEARACLPANSSHATPDEATIAERLRTGLLASRLRWLDQHVAGAPAAAAFAANTIEELRHVQPEEASRLAHRLAAVLCPHLSGPLALDAFAMAAGAYASARRALGDLEAAVAATLTGYPVACQAGPLVEARFLSRIAAVLRDHARLPSAIAVAQEASALYAREGDLHEVVRATVQHGTMRLLADQLDEAVLLLTRALAALPEGEKRTRLAALHALGRAYAALGKIEMGEHCLLEAEGLLDPERHDEKATALLVRGNLALQAGEHGRAEQLYREAREATQNPWFEIIVTLDLLDLLTEQQRVPELLEQRALLADRLSGISRCSTPAQAALAALVRIDARQLSRSAIKKARKLVDRERRH